MTLTKVLGESEPISSKNSKNLKKFLINSTKMLKAGFVNHKLLQTLLHIQYVCRYKYACNVQ
jgi:hypothetical protein